MVPVTNLPKTLSALSNNIVTFQFRSGDFLRQDIRKQLFIHFSSFACSSDVHILITHLRFIG